MIKQATCAVLLLTVPLSAQTITKDFDNVSAPGPFHFIFPGLANGPLLEYPEVTLDGGVILLDVLFGNSATTSPNIYATCDTCTLGDPPPSTGLPGVISGNFPQGVSSVECDLYNGFGGPGSFTLSAYDITGQLVASDTQAVGAFGTPSFQSHLSVSAPGIRSFEVTTNLATGYTFAIDTLRFTLEGDIGTALCTSTPNSSGGAAQLSAAGSTSVAANSLSLRAEPLPANTFGLMFYGPNSIQVPFGDGFRCVGGSLYRLPVTNSGPQGILSTGADLTSPPNPGGQVTAGSTWYYQAWFRDLPAGGAGFNLSDSLRIQFTN